jgi:hypothetical protein
VVLRAHIFVIQLKQHREMEGRGEVPKEILHRPKGGLYDGQI